MSARIPKILSHLNVLIHDNDIVCIDKLRMDRNAFHILASLAKNIEGLIDSKNMSMLLVKPNPVLEDDTDDRWKWFKEGSVADGRVLRDVVVRKNGLKVPQGNYYLCDGGNTNGNSFMFPYRGYRYWIKDWQGNNLSPRCREELFNMKHARARNVIEREFELLKGRWEILRSPSWYSVKVHNRIISACCLIHNFIGREMEADPLDVEMEFHMENQQEPENINTIEASDEWTTWTDELAQSMWNERLENQFIEMASSTAATSNTSRKRGGGGGINTFISKEIFGKDRATGEFAKGPEDVVEEIERIEAQEINNGMSLGFPFVVIDVDDASGKSEDQTTQEEPNVSTGATQSPFTAQDEPNELTGAVQSSFTTQKGETHQSHKQANTDALQIAQNADPNGKFIIFSRLFSSYSNHKGPIKNTKYSDAIMSTDYMLLGLVFNF
ncbi:hypothetical protein KY285_034500 [Solanum tuberosum]|nr:hypothetical protein KY285_034500 [Solanum tuberosum]